MTIKGKTRSRARRVVAVAPRPQPVVPKPPPWRRRAFLVPFALVLLAATAAAVVVPLRARAAREAREELRRRQAQAVQAFSNAVVAAFPEDREIVPPDLYFFFRSLDDDLDKLGKGELDPAEARRKASQVVRAAEGAAEELEGIDLDRLVPAEFTPGRVAGSEGPGLMRADLDEARYLMAQAFRVYATVGTLMRGAAEATGGDRRPLVDRARAAKEQAENLFSRGYLILAQVRARVGIHVPIRPVGG